MGVAGALSPPQAAKAVAAPTTRRPAAKRRGVRMAAHATSGRGGLRIAGEGCGHRLRGPRGDVRTGASTAPRSGDTRAMGFNPHRQHRRSPLDYVMVVAALAVCLALVIWAFFG